MPTGDPATASVANDVADHPTPVIAQRPRAPSAPTYADILTSSMAPSADTISFAETAPASLAAWASSDDRSTNPATTSDHLQAAPPPAGAPAALTEPKDPDEKITDPAGCGTPSDGAKMRRSADDKRKGAEPVNPTTMGRLVLEKLTLWETKSVRLHSIAWPGDELTLDGSTETLCDRFEPSRLAISSAQD